MNKTFAITILSLTLPFGACSRSEPASTPTPTKTAPISENLTSNKTTTKTVEISPTPQLKTPPIKIHDELIINRKFTGETDEERYKGWQLIAPWRTNNTHNNLVFDLKTDGPTGYFTAQTIINNIAAYSKLKQASTSSPESAKLTNIKLNSITYAPAASFKLGSEFQGKFFSQIEIETHSGIKYRGQTNPISLGQNHPDSPNVKLPYEGELKFNRSLQWATYKPFQNNPFTDNAGLSVVDIKSIAYKWIMNVQKANTNGAGTVFLTFDNASATFTVEISTQH